MCVAYVRSPRIYTRAVRVLARKQRFREYFVCDDSFGRLRRNVFQIPNDDESRGEAAAS